MSAAVELTLPAKPEYLILARLALTGLARTLTVDDELLADLKLAVTEACGNAVRHAYPDGSGHMHVRYVVDGPELEITVEDDGAGLSAAVTTPVDPVEVLAESGMGVAIMRATMDEVTVAARPDGPGTVVTMRKRLRAGEPATESGLSRRES
jgi:serine/threonine-protein kinase RsbW